MAEPPFSTNERSRGHGGYGAIQVQVVANASERRLHRTIRWCAELPVRILLGAIWIYQRAVSPILPVVFGAACGCRFAPTCSHYAAEALREHGAIVGGFFAARRLLKCTPLHPGGVDPVPARRTPVCRASAATSRRGIRPAGAV